MGDGLPPMCAWGWPILPMHDLLPVRLFKQVSLHICLGADEGGDIDLEALHTGVSARSRQAARDLPERLQQMLAGVYIWVGVGTRVFRGKKGMCEQNVWIATKVTYLPEGVI
eukprot:1159997-Pelagomonas_calceolata.AAC.7